MKSRFLIVSISLIVCSLIFSNVFYWWKGGKKVELLRENEAQLKPHQQKIVDQCLERLQKESFKDSLELILKPQADFCSVSPVTVQQTPLIVRMQFTEIFFDRRKLKLNKHIEQLQENERSKIVSDAFHQLFGKYNKTVDADARRQLGGAFPEGVVWAMYATARFGSQSDLLYEIDQVREAAKSFFNRFVKEGGS